MSKIRLDQLLVERELVETRSRAAALILAGKVYVKDQKVDKAGFKVAADAEVEVRGESLRYVSRGGLKLEAALDAFNYDCAGKIVIDVGASTGGFTDCVLQRGAAQVWAVDVGYGQLAWRLRQDPRVQNIERANIRHLATDAIPTPCALAVIDCSFISLDKVLPNTLAFLTPDADVIALIKPQFEVGPQHVGKGGVVRDMAARTRSIEAVVANAEALGLTRLGGIDCPVHGPAGNIEYLVWLKRQPALITAPET